MAIANSNLPWHILKGKRIVITGARGLIGSFLIDVLMSRNELYDEGIKVYALGRNERLAKTRFAEYIEKSQVRVVKHDVNSPIPQLGNVDFIIHAASNTHPIAYANDPIGTITTNIFGAYNLLNFAIENSVNRFIFVSSVEVYGENRGDTEYFDESYCGYIDCNSLRSGYPESKRAGEALCNAYAHEHGIEIVIPRLSRVYGPTMLPGDTKAISQFINKAMRGEDVILKSKGSQMYSFCYVADAISGLLAVLLGGQPNEAYNISGLGPDVTLRDLAQAIANLGGVNVRYELPDEQESKGYSKATKALVDISKIRSLAWRPRYTIERGLKQTFEILRAENAI